MKNRSLRTGVIALSVLLAVFLSIIAWRAKESTTTNPAGERLSTFQGEKAVEYLRHEGLYGSLGQAMRRARYGIKWTDGASLPNARGAYAAANPAQSFYSFFTPDGLHLADSSQADRAWRMELELRSVGYGARQRKVSAGRLSADGTLIEYRREVGSRKVGRRQKAEGSQAQSPIPNPQPPIVEWYVNREDGLEQGFTLAAAPGERRVGERLRVKMALEGDLRARTTETGDAIELLRASGERVLRYEHLVVKDATGRKLEAVMGAERGQVWLDVDDVQAVWPVTIDPVITQQAYLKASNTGGGDIFGRSVAISGDTVVVGAPSESSNATGVNGDQNDNSASDTDTGDLFGFSVAVSGDTVVVGAPDESSNAKGVNGNQSDNSAANSGAAYVFVAPSTCTITCPASQFAGTGPGANQCCAVVDYPAPAADSGCGTVTCTPASGSCFPVGTTTVTCSTDAGPGCSFTVTVTDNTPPTITCPASINAVGTASCPIATSATANFTVTASDNCPGVTLVCKNQNNQVVSSGSPLPVGTTTVTCTATDASGNTASCSFTVSVFSFCLQDETNPSSVVLVNAQTGDYVFCCGGAQIASGRGTLTTRGCIGSINQFKGDREVHIQWDTSANNSAGAGTASVQKRSNKIVCQITDKNMTNNTCACQ